MIRSIAILMIGLALAGVSGATDIPDESTAVEQSAGAFGANQEPRSTEFLQSLGIETPVAVVMQQACCKICRAGKACGDTCISRDKVCHVGPGCACDG
jgi:hypothetical protein